MDLLRRLAIFCCLAISIVSAKQSSAQHLDEVISFAGRQFELGNYQLSAKEYNRAVFFGAGNQDMIYIKIAQCYFNTKDYALSNTFFDKSYFASSSDSIKAEAVLGKAFNNILQGRYMPALTELMNLDTMLCPAQDIKANFYAGIAYFGMNENQQAAESFKACLKYMGQEEKMALMEDEFDAIRKWGERYNPKTAWVLSLIIPGSGQLYAGEVKEAANSMILTGGLLYLSILLSRRYSFFEAVLTVLPWFQRYYLGGAGKAEKYANEAFLRERYNSYRNILNLMEDE
ncbi:hypothetical protein MNBD_BACTEROID01-326 [hydrothermal vent metagenome]|uniref:Tetratricopeptide repeat protein n=1 Tax=hydrothermal vent metagenome TaxID=652676 RepID=A0A3B0TNB4_9ZZZZ